MQESTPRDPGKLRQVLVDAAQLEGLDLKDLTVLAEQRDPFRLDIESRHRDGQWLADAIAGLGIGDRLVHLRGLHYMLATRKVRKPNGQTYANTDKDWAWLGDFPGKAARWLGYVPFGRIVDERNAEPVVRLWQPSDPEAYLTVDVKIEIPAAEDLKPHLRADGFVGAQPHKLVLFGEKSSLQPILGPVAEDYQADLYLPTGEISDTLLHGMAEVGATDGRPMVVVCFSDCDPAGWQMPTSIARKLHALKLLHFPELEFRVYRAALTPDQVRAEELPDTPLKKSEKRGSRWQQAMGVKQTEIDALAALKPAVLDRIAREALDPFFDHDLAGRVDDAWQAWVEAAQETVIDQLGAEALARFRDDAIEKLAAVEVEVQALREALRLDTSGINLPALLVPDATLDGKVPPTPLVDSAWSFAVQSLRLIADKGYEQEEDPDV